MTFFLCDLIIKLFNLKRLKSCWYLHTWYLRMSNVWYIDRRTTSILRSLAGASMIHYVETEHVILWMLQYTKLLFKLLFLIFSLFSFSTQCSISVRELHLASTTGWMSNYVNTRAHILKGISFYFFYPETQNNWYYGE